MVVTLVLTSLDYGNAVLVGLPTYLVQRLYSRHWMLLHAWSFTCDLPITSLTRWPLFTPCAFRRGSN